METEGSSVGMGKLLEMWKREQKAVTLYVVYSLDLKVTNVDLPSVQGSIRLTISIYSDAITGRLIIYCIVVHLFAVYFLQCNFSITICFHLLLWLLFLFIFV